MNKYEDEIIILETGLDIKKLQEECSLISTYYDKLNNIWTAYPLRTPNGTNDNKYNLVHNAYKNANQQFINSAIVNEKMPYITSIINDINCKYGSVKLVRLLKLKAHSNIPQHMDEISKTNNGKRLIRMHVPIITDKNVIMCIEKQPQYHMFEGNMYYFPFHIRHGVINNSDIDRIHLVIDVEISLK